MENGFQTVNLQGCVSGVIATPAIGENGHWWIGNTDTGISASGMPGPKGDQGEQGPVGPKGDNGEAADMSRIEALEKQMAGLNSNYTFYSENTTLTENVALNIPNSFRDLLILVYVQSKSPTYENGVCLEFTIPYCLIERLVSKDINRLRISSGYCHNSSNAAAAWVYVTQAGEIGINTIYYNNNNVVTNSYAEVYYR